MFVFRGFGQIIQSDLAIPEFEQIASPDGAAIKPDLRIVRRSLPPVPAAELNAEFFRVKDGVIDFEIEGIVRVRIPDRHVIEYNLVDPEREREARLYVTGSAFGAWTFLTGRFPFHCGLVTKGEFGVALTGPSGAGKSTLTTALVEHGFGFMSDDVVVFDQPDPDTTTIIPSFARIKLWQDAADHFAIQTGGLNRLHAEMEKFHVPFPQDKIVEHAVLGAVFRLKFEDDCESVTCRRLSHLEALKELRANIYRLALIPELGLEGEAFRMVTNILKTVPVFEITRPRDFDRFDETIAAITAQVDALRRQP